MITLALSDGLINEFMGVNLLLAAYAGDAPINYASYDGIMPVVEKIEAMKDVKVHVSISGKSCTITTYRYLKKTDADTKLMAIHYAVVEFLEWYNKLKRTPIGPKNY